MTVSFGLLHDIGKLVLCLHFTELFGLVWESAKEDGLSFYEAERKLSPVSHAQIGGYLAKKWQFPDSLVDSISNHHAIEESVSNLNQLIIVHTANTIANNHKGDSEINPDYSTIDPVARRIMSGQLETVSEWFPDVATEIESACEFFLKED